MTDFVWKFGIFCACLSSCQMNFTFAVFSAYGFILIAFVPLCLSSTTMLKLVLLPLKTIFLCFFHLLK